MDYMLILTLSSNCSPFSRFGFLGATTLLLYFWAAGPSTSIVPLEPTSSPNGPTGIAVTIQHLHEIYGTSKKQV